MRTNIVIDEKLMAEVMAQTGIKTKRRAVEEGLRSLLRSERAKSVLALRGKLKWEGNLEEMRLGRNIYD